MRFRPALAATAVFVAMTGLGAQAAVIGTGNTTMSISGQITSDAGTGIAGMCVTAYSNAPNGPSPAVAGTATSSSLGYYRVTISQRSDTDEYFVTATADCGAGGWWQPTSNPNRLTLAPSPGKNTATGINMTALPAGRMVGRITDNANGAAMSGATAEAVSQSGGVAGQATTDAQGSYVVGGLAPGTYTLWAATSDYKFDVNHAYLASYAHHQPSVAAAQFFDVVVGQSVEVNESLLHSGRIDGQVTDAQTGLPLRDVAIDVYPLSGLWPNTSDVFTGGQGKFSVTVGPGTYAVCFRDPGGRSNVVPHVARCYKNKPWVGSEGPFTDTTAVAVDGYGVVVRNINQKLPLANQN